MSLYRDAIALGSGGRGTAFVRVAGQVVDIGADATALAQWTAANTELQRELKSMTAAFPKSFTAQKAAETLDKAVIYGRKMLGKYGGFLSAIPGLGEFVTGVNTGGLQVAINKADDESKKWRSKIPVFGDGYVYVQNQNGEWADVNGQVVKIYVEAAGLVGQRIVSDEAQRDLAKDLNPVAPVNLVKIALIAGAAAGVVIYLPQVLKQLKPKGAVTP